jgi:hypothetical protein
MAPDVVVPVLAEDLVVVVPADVPMADGVVADVAVAVLVVVVELLLLRRLRLSLPPLALKRVNRLRSKSHHVNAKTDKISQTNAWNHEGHGNSGHNIRVW